jgi:glycosyltransferase involved in cell wall biosynthesis
VTRRQRMLVICPFPQGVAAGQRLKYEQYFDDWRAQGYEISVSPFMDIPMWSIVHERGHVVSKALGVVRGHFRRLSDLFRISRFDVVYVFMWVTPFGTSIFERLTRWLAPKIIYDVEDNVISDLSASTQEHVNPITKFLKNPGKPRYLIREADHVITSSPFLNHTCLTINRHRRCTYVTSSVDTDRFVPALRYSNEAKVTIGWTGTVSSKLYLDTLEPVFRRLAERVPFKLRVIGNFDYHLPGIDLEVVRWSAEREVEDLQAIDIGVYPLIIDDWVLGKSGLKAIQYMAFGLPVVATDVGTTPTIIHHGEDGVLVRTEDEWVEALQALVMDPQLRSRLGQAARADALAKYSTKAVAAQYRAVLESVAD